MANLTANFNLPGKSGNLVRIQQAAAKHYFGGAAGVIVGTGYATPLVVATAGMAFIGVYQDDFDNTNGVAGTVDVRQPGSGYASWTTIARKGIFPFHQTGITQAAVRRKVYFSDDNTVTLTPGAIEAGLVVTVDEQSTALAWVEIDAAVRALSPLSGNLISASGAISPHNAGVYVITKAGVAAMTLAAPTATVDDFLQITVTSNTANAHTITATGLFEDGAATVNLATFPAQAGATITLMAYQAKWLVISNNLVVMS